GKDVVIDGGKMARSLFGYSASENTNNVVDRWDYDYGDAAGSQGALLRRLHTDFLTTYNNAAGDVYLRDLISSEKVYKMSGNLASQVDYFYDESTPTNAPGIVQNMPAGSQRGNL